MFSKSSQHNVTFRGGSLSEDATQFAVPNSRQGFDIYRLENGVHLKNFTDRTHSRAVHNALHPVLFIHGGKWLLGGGIGNACIWHIESGTKVQTLQNASAGGSYRSVRGFKMYSLIQ
jgi:acetyl esterase/lipase